MLTRIGSKLYNGNNLFSGIVNKNLSNGKVFSANYSRGLLQRAEILEKREIEDITNPIKGIKYYQLVKSVKEYFYEQTEKLSKVRKNGFDVFSVKRQMTLDSDVHHIDIISGNQQIRMYDCNGEIKTCVFPRNKIFSILEHEGDAIHEQRFNITDNPNMAKIGNITINGTLHFLEPDRYISHNKFTQESIITYLNSNGRMTKKVLKNPRISLELENRYTYDNMNNVKSIETYSDGKYVGGEIFQYDEKGILREHIEVVEGKSTKITRYSDEGEVIEQANINLKQNEEK